MGVTPEVAAIETSPYRLTQPLRRSFDTGGDTATRCRKAAEYLQGRRSLESLREPSPPRDSGDQSSEASDWRRELPFIESNSIASDPPAQSP